MADILQMIFSNVFSCVELYFQISLEFVPIDSINIMPALVHIMAT